MRPLDISDLYIYKYSGFERPAMTKASFEVIESGDLITVKNMGVKIISDSIELINQKLDLVKEIDSWTVVKIHEQLVYKN